MISVSKRIFLGMPGYGNMTAAASRGFWRCCRDMDRVHLQYQNGSLLACNFNMLWSGALNFASEGEGIAYFAMLHDDIGPQEFWLDDLIAELEAKQLDVLGVVAPIKDTRGMTSIALHRDGDNWRPRCRLSMRDVFCLPETFTSEDIGSPLLINTGCWVAKFDLSWAKKVHFTINDRIVMDSTTGKYKAQTEPEDWYFSRLLHELGLKVGATRKIAIQHQGAMNFTNSRPWGSEAFDRESVNVSPVKNAFPHDVEGWLSEEEGHKLSELAAGKRVLEIGSYCGRSTICLARSAEHVTAVDYFDGRATAQPQLTLQKFVDNLERYGLREKVTVHHPDEPLTEQYDFAFIDGAHDYQSVTNDAHRASMCLAEGGLLAFHDYASEHDREVAEAVNDFVLVGAEILGVYGSLAVVKPPVQIPQEV